MTAAVRVFAGPTLSAADRQAYPEFEFLPPAAQGDVYRACQDRPRAVALIDGYFDGVAAIWHKEILWAMSQGIYVYGAASMGALRAAELHAFGMRGHGWIFEAFRDGRLTDDDEVAVQHGPAELDYAAISVPMVNVRATLAAAQAENILPQPACERVIASSKQQFYQQRTWDGMLIAAGQVLSASEFADFNAWLPNGQVDQKRADALSMLAEVHAFVAGSPPPMRFEHAFENTQLWANASWRTRPGPAETTDLADRRVLDELRLRPDDYRRIRRLALARHRVVTGASEAPAEPDAAALQAGVARFCEERALYRGRDRVRWLADNRLSDAEFRRLLSSEIALEELARTMDSDLWPAMLAELRLAGCYPEHRARADEKARALPANGLADLSPARAGLDSLRLRLWYFEHRLNARIPDDPDDYARTLGLAGPQDLDRLLTAEYLFVGRAESAGDRTRD